MASVTTKLNDEELRARLLKLGLNPGPITDTTRPLYLSKLRALSSSGAALTASNGSHPPSDGRTRKGWHKGQLPQRKPPAPPQDRVRHPNAHVPANPSSRPRPVQVVPAVQQLSSPGHGSAPRASYSPATVSPSQAEREGGAQAVVSQLLSSLNDHTHLASDTVFLFPDGEVLLASRSLLAIRCQQMVPILYSREEPYPVNVSTLSGSITQVFVRASELVQDMKEKLSLCQGTPVLEQRLVFMQNELPNEQSLGSCGIGAGATVHLVLVAPTPGDHVTTYFTSVVSPSLSISHVTLGLGLDRLMTPRGSPYHHPPRVALSPHIAHIVHVYDVPSNGFTAFVRYLYSGELMWEDSSTALACCVCCYVLAEAFHLPSLSQTCLGQVPGLLTVDSALPLVQFAEGVGSSPLRTICMEYLEMQQIAQQT